MFFKMDPLAGKTYKCRAVSSPIDLLDQAMEEGPGNCTYCYGLVIQCTDIIGMACLGTIVPKHKHTPSCQSVTNVVLI